jgi:hypothetical protein
MASILIESSKQNSSTVIPNKSNNKLSFERNLLKHPSVKHLFNNDTEINNNPLNINIHINENINEHIKKFPINKYSINIISTMTKLSDSNEVFFIKNDENTNEKKTSLNKTSTISIGAFNKEQIEIDKQITKSIQNGEDYDSIYATLINHIKNE